MFFAGSAKSYPRDSSFDVLIVGAGIMGTAAARELAEAGMRVGVIESNSVGSGITAAGMGHLVVMDDSPAQLALTVFSRSLWQRDVRSFPASVEFAGRGTIWVAADEEEMAGISARKRTFAAAGVASQVLNARALAESEPNLRPGLAGGLLVPGDAVVNPPAGAEFYLQKARDGGAILIHSRAVSASQGEVLLDSGETLRAPRIVLATGVDCSLMPALPIQKRKGHLAITEPAPGFLHHQLVELGYLKSAHQLHEDSVAFNVQPRGGGQIVIGSSRQYGNDDPRVDQEVLDNMRSRANAYMPELAGLETARVWTGFRAATPDHLPLIGPAAPALGPGCDPSLWLAAGFEGLGTTSAPGAAALLADAMLGRESQIDRNPYLPARLLKEKA